MPFQRLTLADLQADLESLWESSPFWSSAESVRLINHSLRTWNLLTGFWKKKVLVTTNGTHYRSLPASLTFGMQVVWGPTGLPLSISALADLDWGRPRWEEEYTVSGGTVPSTPQLWAPVGLTTLALWPAPAAGLPILVDGVAATPVLTLPGDYVDIGDADASAIVGYALHVGTFKRGIAAVQATAGYLKDFLAAARAQNERLVHSLFFRKALGLDQERTLRPAFGPLVPPAPPEAEGRAG